jgi:dTDP-4-amino-4,6-dideoxygalactose transaminase
MEKITNIIVPLQCRLIEALNILNSSEFLILLIVNGKGKLVRTVTDGDIRRFILSKGRLDVNLEKLSKKNPIAVRKDVTDTKVLKLMIRNGINQIPVVDNVGRPIGLHIKSDLDKSILLSTPHMGKYEENYVQQAFDSNWIAPIGPNVDAFEVEISNYVGGSNVAVVNSGTSAIHLSLILLNISQGDLVFCQSFTFIASVNPVLYQGATPVFIDSESKTWNMSPIALRKALEDHKKKNTLPKAIIVVHLYGNSASMKKIMSIGNEYNVPVIEDAAESIGSFYQGKHTGTMGKFGIFSFNGNKIITTSGGGALISNDIKLIDRARFLSTQAKDPSPHYEHSEIGYNYRMSNVLAGIGRGQLKVLNERVRSRRNVLKKYKKGLNVIDSIDWIPDVKGDYSNNWLSVFSINPKRTNMTAKTLINALLKKKIEARHVWKPMHQQKLFIKNQYYTDSNESFCDYLFETGVCLPSSSNMSASQQDLVIENVIKIFEGLNY